MAIIARDTLCATCLEDVHQLMALLAEAQSNLAGFLCGDSEPIDWDEYVLKHLEDALDMAAAIGGGDDEGE